MEHLYDTAIVGGGIAGYSAALTAKNLKLDYLWLGDAPFSGKTQVAEYVRNYPSFTGDGKLFVQKLEEQREIEQVVLTQARVDGIYHTKSGYIITCGSVSYSARTVILCTGVELRGSVQGEGDFLGRGVSYCAVCDGALYRGRSIAAVLYDARFAHEVEYLSGFADMVYAFCVCEPPVFASDKIKVIKGAPLAVGGEGRIGWVKTAEGELSVDGVFFLRNAVPPASLVGGLLTEGAHVRVGRDMSTNLEGLFAAGDVTGTPYQYAKAAGEGLVAAYSARAYLHSSEN